MKNADSHLYANFTKSASLCNREIVSISELINLRSLFYESPFFSLDLSDAFARSPCMRCEECLVDHCR